MFRVRYLWLVYKKFKLLNYFIHSFKLFEIFNTYKVCKCGALSNFFSTEVKVHTIVQNV